MSTAASPASSAASSPRTASALNPPGSTRRRRPASPTRSRECGGVAEEAPPGERHEQAGMDEVTDLHRALPGWVLRCLEHIPARAVCPGPLSPAPAAPVTPLPSWAGRHQGTPDRYDEGVGSG